MILKEGIVTGAAGTKAWVKTVRSKTCEACESKDSCAESNKPLEITIQVENSLNAGTGDRVIVGFKTGPLMKITFMLYVFPIILLIAGAATGQALAPGFGTDPSLTSLGAGMFCFCLSFGVIRFINNSLAKNNEYKPFLMRFAAKADSTCQPQ